MPYPVELTIEDIGGGGDGIARLAGGAVYVPNALPGERLRVELGAKRGKGREARLLQRLTDAPERVAPPCPHFGVCGGCRLQHLDFQTYLDWKRGRVIGALAHRGMRDVSVAPCIASLSGSRRRARFRAFRTKDGVAIGFNERRGRRVVQLESCMVLRPPIVALLAPLRPALQGLMSRGETWEIQITETETGLDLWLPDANAPGLPERQLLAEFGDANDLARIAIGAPDPEVVVRRQPAVHRMGSAMVEPSPATFLQASRQGEAAIVGEVLRRTPGDAAIIDLFAGCGTLSLPLAEQGPVHAVDTDATALDTLLKAANNAAGLKAVTTEVRDLFRRPLLPGDLAKYDGAVFDPPRAGARRQAEAITHSPLAVAVAVSCNPETFARDARILVNGGFRLEEVSPIDQFLWSPHVELVARFSR